MGRKRLDADGGIMTLLHTKGYFEVLESVKKRAKDKAKILARAPILVTAEEAIRLLARRSVVQVTLACEEAAPDSMFEDVEEDELQLTFAEDFLHHYRFELELVRSEKASEKENNHRPDDPLGPWAAHHDSGCDDCEAAKC